MNDDYVPEHRADDEPVIGDAPPQARIFLSNKAYDNLRFFALVLLPALGALYFGLSQIWGLPKAEEIVGSLVVIDTFLGVLLRQARVSYEKSDARFDGDIIVSPGDDEHTSDLNMQLDSAALVEKDEVVVKVRRLD